MSIKAQSLPAAALVPNTLGDFRILSLCVGQHGAMDRESPLG